MDNLFPQVVFHVFGIPVRDTVISTWIMMALIVGVAILIQKRFPMAVEMLIDFLNDTISDVIGRPAYAYIPMLGTLAIFIAIADNFGIVPMMSTPTKDINTPLALALVVFVLVHYYGVREKGMASYLKAQASPLVILDIVGQLSRTMSLTLRLFGNIVSGELVVAVIFSLVPIIAPLPMIGLSIFTGILQAYIFTILASSYIASAIE
ncbi:MAG: F0F1 ATP synthase subunit A [Anaerolineae bacterium]|nr:F0F1 ATP synthase subunit A [Anaerolineae bacterium]